ncbi:MAG: hypothetical protein IPP44_00455 [Ideonella sp.]|nr:hypothetical protein [Ideonella sp.]
MTAVELAADLLLRLFEVAVWIVLYSIRPARYMLRSDFRARVDAEFLGRSPFFKWLYLVSSSLLVAFSLLVIVALIYFFREAVRPEPMIREKATTQAISTAVRAFSKHASRPEK